MAEVSRAWRQRKLRYAWAMSHALILGCGTVGVLTAQVLAAQGWSVTGVRRRPLGDEPCAMLAGDAADPALLARCPMPDAVALCASPGLRRGRDNGLERIATAVTARWPRCRLVYTGSTAVYADLNGADADEDAALGDDAAVTGLVAIERAVLAHADALVLRATALVGPTRTHARERLAAGHGAVTVAGDPERPFAYLHEADCATLLAEALGGAFARGILNAAAPTRITLRDYYQHHADALGLTLNLAGDGRPAPRRWINARRLHRLTPGRTWRGLD